MNGLSVDELYVDDLSVNDISVHDISPDDLAVYHLSGRRVNHSHNISRSSEDWTDGRWALLHGLDIYGQRRSRPV